MLTIKQLKEIKCSNPDCDHKEHDIIFNSKCHTGAPTLAIMHNGNELITVCAICQTKIIQIEIVEILKSLNMVKDILNDHTFGISPACHNSGTFTKYMAKTGHVKIICAECNKVVCTIKVKKE